MKDVIFTITANTRKVAKTKDFLGINGENLQDNIIVDFSDEFIDGYAYFEVDFGTSKGFIGMTKVEQHYVVPIQSSLLAVAGKIYCQIRIDVPVDENTMSVFKSEKFEIPVLEAINAEGTVPEEYPTWVETADLKLAEVDTALANMQSATSKPNLLINSNFAINQRGQQNYTAAGYTVDRVRLYTIGNIQPVLTPKAGGGISVSGTAESSNQFLFGYHIENPATYAGQTLTLSVKISNVTGSGLKVRTASGSTGYSNSITSATLYTKTFTVDSSVTSISIIITTASAGAFSLDIDWWKLEIGSVATAYNPPLIAEELVKCQRYYRIDRMFTQARSAYTLTQQFIGFYEMRTAPTCAIYSFDANNNEGNENTLYDITSRNEVAFTRTPQYRSKTGFVINSDGGFTTDHLYSFVVKSDAEIY